MINKILRDDCGHSSYCKGKLHPHLACKHKTTGFYSQTSHVSEARLMYLERCITEVWRWYDRSNVLWCRNVGKEGFAACVISSSLADRGRGTSANRKLVGVVEIRCDWLATHIILKENIELVSELPLNTVQKYLKCRLFRMELFLLTEPKYSVPIRQTWLDMIYNQSIPFHVSSTYFLKIYFNIIRHFYNFWSRCFPCHSLTR